MKRDFVALVLAVACCVPASPSMAVDSEQTAESPGASRQELPVYGSQFMTPEERLIFQQRLHAARSQEEWDRMRWQHHQLMRARAWQRGFMLPPEPPPWPGCGGYGPGCCFEPGLGVGLVPVMPRSFVVGPDAGPGPWMAVPSPVSPLTPSEYPPGYRGELPVWMLPPPALEERTFIDNGDDNDHEEEHER